MNNSDTLNAIFTIIGGFFVTIAGVMLKQYIPKLAQWAKAIFLNAERVDTLNALVVDISAQLSEARKHIATLEASIVHKDEIYLAEQKVMKLQLADMQTNLETMQRLHTTTYQANLQLQAEKQAISEKAERQAEALQDAALRITALEQQHEDMQAQLKLHSAAQDFAKQIVSHVANGIDAIFATQAYKLKEVTP